MPDSDERGDESGVTDELTIYRRHLPHWEVGGSTYFITCRLHGTYPASSGVGLRRPPSGVAPQPACPPAVWRAFAPQERHIIMRTILFWHDKRWFVYALTVMPDHVHILARPLEKSSGVWYPLRGLLHSVKRTTAWEINRLRGRRGRLWQSERMDRMVRSQAEFDEKAGYILDNAQRKGLVEDGWGYEWFWCPGKEELRRLKGG